MKRMSIAILFCGILFMAACDSLFVDVSGQKAKLQGKWQQKGTDNVYYNFQNNLFQYQIYVHKDSILSINGYYSLLGDTAIYLELFPRQTFLNNDYAAYPLDFLQWDAIPGDSGVDTLTQRFYIKTLTGKELNLVNESKDYIFIKF